MSMNNCIKSIDRDSPLRGKANIGDAVVSINGKDYKFPCPDGFNADKLAVKEVNMQLPSPVNADALKITISGNKELLCISEMEIWSQK